MTNFDLERRVYFSRPAYARAVDAAGGLPVLVPYLDPRSAEHLLETLDGVILSGGGDLDPQLYGEPPHPAVEAIIPERDAFELQLARLCLERQVPVLGICRGVQVLGVAAGGTLHVDLPLCVPNARDHRRVAPLERTVHPVVIEPGSQLAAICRLDRLEVNSWHHQAVKAVPSSFRISARAPDGVVEGIESLTHRFAVGVQWHPENLWETVPACRHLFAALVAACAR